MKKMGWIRKALCGLTVLLLATGLLWGLLRFGATEILCQYSLFLLLTIAALAAVFTYPSEPLRRADLFFLAAGVFLLAQTAFRGPVSGNGYLAASLGWLVFFLAFTLTSQQPRIARLLVLLLILFGGIETGAGLVQSLGGVDYIGSYHRELGREATGTFISHNHFAGFLNMVIPLAIGVLFVGFSKRIQNRQLRSEIYSWVWIGLIGLSLMGLAVFLSLSRAGSATLLTTLAFLIVLIVLNRQKTNQQTLSSIVPAAVMLLSLLLVCGLGLDALMTRFATLEGSWQDRSTVYNDTVQLISDNPLFGVGPGMYQWRFRLYQTLSSTTWWKNAHNDYLHIAAEWGIPAALLFWGFVAWCMLKSVRGFLASRNPWNKGILLGAAGAIFSILIHSLVDFNLHIPANFMVFCAILGLSWTLDSPLARRGQPEGMSCPQGHSFTANHVG